MFFIYFNLQDFIVIKTNTIFRGNFYPKNSKENLNKIKNFRSLFYLEKETKPLNLGINFCRISTNNSIENRFVQDFYSKVLVWFRFNLDFEENICLKFALSLPITPIFIYCDNPDEKKRSSKKRRIFLKEKLDNLKHKLSRDKVDFLILEENSYIIIPKIIEKFNITQIIYSLNAFLPLKLEQEKKFLVKMKKINVQPLIFTFDPLTMKTIHFNFKKKITNFSSYFKDISLDIKLYKGNETLKDEDFLTKTRNFYLTNAINKNLPNQFSEIQENNPLRFTDKFFCKEKCRKFHSKQCLSKDIFSEFNIGSRISFNNARKETKYKKILLEKVIINSRLKVFYLIKKLSKMHFLNQYLMDSSQIPLQER